jgi:hypothetical protein
MTILASLGYFLQDKSETQGTLKCFLRQAQNEFELRIKKDKDRHQFCVQEPSIVGIP